MGIVMYGVIRGQDFHERFSDFSTQLIPVPIFHFLLPRGAVQIANTEVEVARELGLLLLLVVVVVVVIVVVVVVVIVVVVVVMWCLWVRRGWRIGFWWGNRWEGKHWGDLGVDGWIILGWISRRWDVGMWTGLGWPRIETGGGRL